MNSFIRALQSEKVKISMVRMLLAMLLLNFIVQLPTLYIYLTQFNANESESGQINIFSDIFGGMLGSLYNFIYPIYAVAIICTLVNVDFKNDGFKLIETQNLGKRNIYLAKVVWSLILTALFLIVTTVYTTVLAKVMYWIVPQSDKVVFEIDWRYVWVMMSRMYVSTLGFMGIIFILIFSFKRPIIVNIIAFIGIIASLIRFMQNLLQKWIPTNYFLISSKNENLQVVFNDYLWASIITFLGAIIIGYLFYTHRNHKALIFKDLKAIVATVLVSVVTIFSVNWILKPNSQDVHQETVITGIVKSKQHIDFIKITDNYYDEIITIPVDSNGNFYAKLDYIEFSDYRLEANKFNLGAIIIKPNDSLYVDIDIDEIKKSVLGTGYADNYLMMNYGSNIEFSVYEKYLNSLKFDEAVDLIKDEYVEKNKMIATITTPDNYTYSKVRRDQMQQILNIQTVNAYDKYFSIYKMKNEVAAINEPEFIANLRKEIPDDDAGLFYEDAYKEYLTSKYLHTDEKLSTIQKFKIVDEKIKEPLKSRMMYDLFYNAIDKSSITQGELDSIYTALKDLNINDKVKQKVQHKYQLASLATKGQILPDFKFIDANEKVVSLSELKGKYVIIDFWATWCGPCKYQAPYFEDFAIQYKDKSNVQFVSISIDQSLEAWKSSLTKANDNILQWHITDEAILKMLNILSIPRFVLLGPNGEIVNSGLPNPSDTEPFKLVLEHNIK